MNDYRVDRQKWVAMSLFEQMGNIGSEVGRSLKAQRSGDDFQSALVRALDLFDATVEPLVAVRSPRAKEVLRAKDQFLSAIYDKPDPAIEDYFMQFALAARRSR